MKQGRIVCLFIMIACASLAYADDAADDAATRILLTFSDPGMSSAAKPGRPGYNRRSSAYLVSFSVKRAANRIAKEYNLRLIDEWPILPLKVHCLVYAVTDDMPVEQLLTDIRARPEVDSAQLLNQFEVSGTLATDTADPYLKLQHNLATLELAQAHTWSRGDGTSVSIIDTGADLSHPELRTQIKNHQDFVNDDEIEFADDAHGTAVAGVISASSNNGIGIVGIAPSTQVTVLKACWYAGTASRAVCDSFTLAKALSYAVESDTDIINLSLGGPSDPLLRRLVDLGLKRGIVVVAAANGPQRTGFPAEIPGVIVVGSDNQVGQADSLRTISLLAPGDEILVPVPGGGFDYASGSSLSAAQVSGIVALLVARRPGLTGDDVTTLLIDSRADIGGSVNACRALAQLLQQSGCRRDDSTAAQSL